MATYDEDKADLSRIRRLSFQGVSDSVDIVTPHNTNAIGPYRAIRSEGAGDISVHCVGDAAATFKALKFLAGETRHIAVDVVRVTGTTAVGQIEGIK